MKSLSSLISGTKKVVNKIKSVNYANVSPIFTNSVIAGAFLYTVAAAGISAVAQGNYSSKVGSLKTSIPLIPNYDKQKIDLNTISLEDARKYDPKEPEGDPYFIGPIQPQGLIGEVGGKLISQYQQISEDDSNFVGPLEIKLEDNSSFIGPIEIISQYDSRFVGPVEPYGLIGEISGKLNVQDSTNKVYGDSIQKLKPMEYTFDITQNLPKKLHPLQQSISIVNKRGKIKGYVTNSDSAFFEANLFYSSKYNAFFNKPTSKRILKDWKKGKKGKALTSFDGQEVLDKYSPPNYLLPQQGQPGSLNYYGTCDINNNSKINWDDHALILGNTSDRADADGDGNPGQINDKNVLENYLKDQTPVLPFDWGFLTTTQKISWKQKMFADDLTNQHPYIPGVFECGEFATTININFPGVKDIANSGLSPSLYDFSKNGKYNIPMYIVATVTNLNGPHTINSNLKGSPANQFNKEEYTEPQTDQVVVPGSQSLNQIANITRFCRVWDSGLNQYVWGSFPVINYANINTTPTVAWQHPDLVINKPVKWTYMHIGGQGPADTAILYQVIYANSIPQPSVSGDVTGKAPWATRYFSDVNNRSGIPGDSANINFDVERDFWAVSDSCDRIDTMYMTNDTRYLCDPAQNIHLRDWKKPDVTENTSQTSIAYSQFIANGLIKPTIIDNCGYWDSTYVMNTTQGTSGCPVYEFVATPITNAWDPVGNDSISSKNVEVYLDETQLTIPANVTIPYWVPTTMANINGPATGYNPAGVPFGITWEINSGQNPDTLACGNVNFTDEVIYTATDSVCGNSSQGTQNVYKYKPMSLICTNLSTIQDTFYIGKNDLMIPSFIWEPEYTDTLKSWYPTYYTYESTLLNVTQTDSIVKFDFTGHESVCNTLMLGPSYVVKKDIEVGIQDQPKTQEDFMIYPNPATDHINIDFGETHKRRQRLRVTDITGRPLEEILVDPNVGEVDYNIGHLPAGMYLVNWGNKTRKFVKTK